MPAVSFGRAHKYAARGCDCGRHASRKEHRRWQELTLLERAGEIRNLREQVVFELAPAVVIGGRKKPALRYIVDFQYEKLHHRCTVLGHPKACPADCDDEWIEILEDCKGVQTPAFRIKLHLMAVQGLHVVLS